MIDVFLPLILVSPNVKEHWATRHKRNKLHQTAVMATIKPALREAKMQLPLTITLTKIGGRKMDEHDNLRMAFKAIVDQIAFILIVCDEMGQNDSDLRLTFLYAQSASKPPRRGIQITIRET